jgi:hypothetical protein
MSWANPEWLWCLLILPVLIGLSVWRAYFNRRPSLTFSDISSFSGLSTGWRTYGVWLAPLLQWAAFALIILALARPQDKNTTIERDAEGIDIMLALDISTSMRAEDLKPNRFEAARDVANDFINKRLSDRIGLIAFARQSFTVVPPTLDYDLLKRLLTNVEIGAIEDGTAIGMGIATAVNRLKESQAKNKEPNKVDKKADFKAKHQTITDNLAPELLEQINPQKTPESVSLEPTIPTPDDFQSPISEIRFAHQQDEWAYLIKRMGLGGRMRQFALHSIFTKQGNNLHIDVDESQAHLDTPMLRQKLDAALSSIYQHNVALSINFAQGVIDSPYLIQQKIDAGRHQQAIDVITSDNNIVQFQQLFSAEIDENSIQAL